MNELITAQELAERLKLTPETVKLWAREGKIPVIRITPKTVRFDPVAVLAALSQREKGETSGC